MTPRLSCIYIFQKLLEFYKFTFYFYFYHYLFHLYPILTGSTKYIKWFAPTSLTIHGFKFPWNSKYISSLCTTFSKSKIYFELNPIFNSSPSKSISIISSAFPYSEVDSMVKLSLFTLNIIKLFLSSLASSDTLSIEFLNLLVFNLIFDTYPSFIMSLYFINSPSKRLDIITVSPTKNDI